MSDIVRHEPQQLTITDQVQFAEYVTQGDLVPKDYRQQPANALLAIGLGQSMGLSPAESIYRIDVIQGKPTASAELIASNIRRAGHTLRIELDEANVSATATIYRADDPEFAHTVTRDMSWAKRMKLADKDNYKKQPLTMLQHRATTAVGRLACPEALFGVQYTADELGDVPSRPRRAAQPVEVEAAPLSPQASDPMSGQQWGALVAAGAELGWAPGHIAELAARLTGLELSGPGDIPAALYDTILETMMNGETENGR